MPKVPKKKKVTPAQLKNKLWELCKQIVRKQYINKDGTWNCFTCGRIIDEPAKAQTGHFIPSSTCGALLRYDLRNLRIQCYHCNINCGGNGAIYYVKMVEEKGQEYVDKLFHDKQKTVKADVIFYKNLIDEYERLISYL